MDSSIAGRARLRTAMLAGLVAAVLGGCGMPFESSGWMPDSRAPGGYGFGPGDRPGHERPEPVYPEEPAHPQETETITISGPSFTLAWDHEGTAHYRVYAREAGTSEWQVLSDLLSEPRFTVSEGQIPYGTYEFAVRSVSDYGRESDRHHSSDETAAPQPWLLRLVAG